MAVLTTLPQTPQATNLFGAREKGYSRLAEEGKEREHETGNNQQVRERKQGKPERGCAGCLSPTHQRTSPAGDRCGREPAWPGNAHRAALAMGPGPRIEASLWPLGPQLPLQLNHPLGSPLLFLHSILSPSRKIVLVSSLTWLLSAAPDYNLCAQRGLFCAQWCIGARNAPATRTQERDDERHPRGCSAGA